MILFFVNMLEAKSKKKILLTKIKQHIVNIILLIVVFFFFLRFCSVQVGSVYSVLLY